MIITRTPFRIPLGGGGTDLPSYYSKHGGFILSAAINKYMYISINKPIVDKLVRIKYSKTEIVDSTENIQHPLAKEALRYFDIKDSIEIVSMADIPSGTGMGSSSSYLVGILKGLHALKMMPVPLQELAEEACKIELDILKKPIGKQDQYLATFGGFTVLDIDRDGKVKVSNAKLSQDTIDELEDRLVLYFTGISRDALSILGEQSSKAKEPESQVAKILTRIKEIGHEIRRSLESGDLKNFAELLDEHWSIKKEMSNKISNSRIDEIYALAKSNGVAGGKIIGAGGGGFFLFYCSGDKKKLKKVMHENGLLEMKFTFDFEGAKILVDFLTNKSAA